MLSEQPKPALTDEQKAIVLCADERVTVTASAGAGKTRVLVERYLRHVLEEGTSPDQILTITFTRKAAAEMKSRIVRGLREHGALEAAQMAETGPIQTIHSFCERLLRENAVEAGIDSAFEILAEAQAGRLVGEAIRDTLASPLEEFPEAERLVSALAGSATFGRARSPYARLESAVETVLSHLRGSGVDLETLQESHRTPDALREVYERSVIAEMPEAVRLVMPPDGDLQDRLQRAYKAANRAVPAWIRGKYDEEVERAALADTCGLVQLACEAWWRLAAKMEELQRFDFTELEIRGFRLLGNSAKVKDRVRDRFRVAMVDEAQDLNRMQYELLSNIGSARELIVGDAQQSIYGFRLADVEQFRDRVAEGASQLTKNWRSQAGILRFVDNVFGQFWTSAYAPMADKPVFSLEDSDGPDYPGVELWDYPNREPSTTAKYVQELLAEGEKPEDIYILTRDGFGSADAHRALEKEGIPSRIAGGSERFYTRMEVRDLANALLAASDPYEDFALLACLHSPMVGLSLDSIVLLAPNLPVFEQLKTFEPPLDEDTAKLAAFLKWFDPLRMYADRLSAWEVLSKIVAESGYLEALAVRRNSAQLIANVRKLLSLAAQEPELGPAEFADRIRAIQDIRHKEGDAPAYAENSSMVTIMTIHKAKGLEFEIVVLPQTHKNLVTQSPEVIADPRLGLVATKLNRVENLAYRFLADRRRERAKDEELRILYVAMTRPKQRLCIALYPPSSSDSVSKRIRSVVGDLPVRGVRMRRPPEPLNGPGG